MAKIYNKKEIVYYVDIDKYNYEAINDFVADLYDTYNNVLRTPNGLHEIRIICTQLI